MGEDLAAFWGARLDEDEAIAREAAGLTECWVAEESAIGVVLVDGEPLIEGHITGLTAHIARHDPARTLREVAADRAILAMYEEMIRHYRQDPIVLDSHDEHRTDGALLALETVVQHRVSVHSGHPDYRPEWKP